MHRRNDGDRHGRRWVVVTMLLNQVRKYPLQLVPLLHRAHLPVFGAVQAFTTDV